MPFVLSTLDLQDAEGKKKKKKEEKDNRKPPTPLKEARVPFPVIYQSGGSAAAAGFSPPLGKDPNLQTLLSFFI